MGTDSSGLPFCEPGTHDHGGSAFVPFPQCFAALRPAGEMGKVFRNHFAATTSSFQKSGCPIYYSRKVIRNHKKVVDCCWPVVTQLLQGRTPRVPSAQLLWRKARRGNPSTGMAFSRLSGDEQGVIFSLLCNTFDPGLAVAFSSASSELRALTKEPRQQLRAGHEAAAAFCHKVGMRSCKALRGAKNVIWVGKNLSSDDLATLGNLDSVLPALERLVLYESSPGPEGMERLFEKLGTGALPALTSLNLDGLPLGDAGASALAAALGRGALPRLRSLQLTDAAIGDAGLTALAPALRRQPALENLSLLYNPLGDKGLAALVAPKTILPPSRLAG